MCTLTWHLYQTRWYCQIKYDTDLFKRLKKTIHYQRVNWDFTVSKSLINSLGSYKYIIHYKYSNQQYWLNVHSTVGFFYLSQWLSCLQRVQMEIETGSTRRCPWRPCTLTPSPFVTPLRLGKGTSSPPCACCGGGGGLQNPQSLLPSTPSLLQRMVPKCQHVPPGLTQACPHCWGGQHGEHSPLTGTPWSKDWLVDWLRYR